MKQEDIDKKIGMPDVDAEWAKFEREVIGQEKTSRKPLYWAIGIAASIALIAGIFLFNHDDMESQQTIAQTTTPAIQKPSAKETAIEAPIESIASLQKEVSTIVSNKQRPSSELLAEAQKQAANDELQGRIAGLTIVPTSADMGTDNTMRLTGTKVAGRDTVRIGGRLNDSILAVIDGQPLMITLNSRLTTEYFNRYLYEHHQFVNQIVVYKDEDNKRPYIEKYGERAKYGVLVISTVPDTLCDAYVQQHPELMQTRRRVEGYVIDEETEEPLPDTWIHCFDNAGAVTDSTGHFLLWLPRGDIKLQAVHVGYVKVRIAQPADTVFTIRMRSAVRIRDVKVVPKTTPIAKKQDVNEINPIR